ncbi:MAG: phage tail sheath subtilisin-like domain-containing protein [Pseudomonadota bacterium]
MAISFNEVPANIRVPFVYVEFDASNAVRGPTAFPFALLLIGQRLSSGTIAADTPIRVTSAAQAATYFGAGSILAEMAAASLENSPTTETWCVALDDLGAGAEASGSIAITGAATAAGTLSVMIGGQRVQVGSTIGQTAAEAATALAAAITADITLPVTAAAATGTVTLTARHKGEVGNGIDIRANYFAGEVLPSGLSVAVTGMSGGTGNPDVADVIAGLGDTHYNIIAHPWTDAANLTTIEAELADRWGPLRQIEGIAVTSARGTHSELGTLGESRNSPHSTILHCSGVPQSPWQIGAAYAAQLAFNGEIDPARPFQTLALDGILPPVETDRFTLAENNLLLFDGISTFSVDSGGVCRIQRAITTYQTSPNGAADTAYLDVNTPLTLGYLRFDFRNYILRKYPRHKLASDDVPGRQGQAIITPQIGKAEAVARFEIWQDLGLVEDIDQFKEELIVERNAIDPNRLDFYLPPNLINQFRVGAAQIGFVL